LPDQNDRHKGVAIGPAIHRIQKILNGIVDADMGEVHVVGKFVEEKSNHKQEKEKAFDCVVAASLCTARIRVEIPRKIGPSLVDHNSTILVSIY
jgi:hypothetical protein